MRILPKRIDLINTNIIVAGMHVDGSVRCYLNGVHKKKGNIRIEVIPHAPQAHQAHLQFNIVVRGADAWYKVLWWELIGRYRMSITVTDVYSNQSINRVIIGGIEYQRNGLQPIMVTTAPNGRMYRCMNHSPIIMHAMFHDEMGRERPVYMSGTLRIR